MVGRAKKLFRTMLRLMGVSLYKIGLARWVIARTTRTRVVLYHAVELSESSYTKGLGVCISPETFALHLDYFQKFYGVMSINDYLATPAEKMHPAPLLITFDDGYASVMEHAVPALEARTMSATVYLIGNAVRGRMVWVNRLNQALNDYPAAAREVLSVYPGLIDRSRRGIIHHIQTTFTPMKIDALICQLESLVPDLTSKSDKLFSSPEDIRQMQTRGIEFGFHSNDHWNLGRCKDKDLDTTLTTNGIEKLINSNTFAYPFGYFSASAIGRLKRQGYKLLMTVGSNNERFSELHLDRTEVFETSSATLFARLEIEEAFVSALRRWLHRRRTQATQLFTPNQKRTA